LDIPDKTNARWLKNKLQKIFDGWKGANPEDTKKFFRSPIEITTLPDGRWRKSKNGTKTWGTHLREATGVKNLKKGWPGNLGTVYAQD